MEKNMNLRKLFCVVSTVLLTTFTYATANAKDEPSAAKCEEQCGKAGVGRATTKKWCEANKCKKILEDAKKAAPAE